MDPTLKNDDIILIDTLQARIGTIRRGDIVVYMHEDAPKVKRVV